jgi:non-ribosomal peptide synthetase component F
MTRGPLKNLILWQNNVLKNQIGYRTLQFAPISFDVHFQEIVGSLTTGGTIFLVDEDVRRDSTALLRFLRAQQINRIFFPFVALQSLVEASSLLKSPLCRK